MAQAYIRQSTFSDGDTITAALFNNEYNQLVNAFAYSSTSASNTGHRHDGTAGQGGNIFKIGDLDFLNKVEIDSTNNRVGFYVEVSSAAVEQLRIQDGALVPVTDNDINLGTSSLEFKDAFFDGTVTTDALVADTADINGGTVDGATIGANSASTGAFTSVTTTGNVDVGGNLTVTGTTTFNGGTITMGDANTDNVVFGADVDSSIIPDDDDSYDLGSSSQEWRNLFIDGTANIDSLVADTADINGGTIDGAIIGGSSAAAITGTTITGTSFVIGSADISEAELETIDGITAGTVAASKAIVVDSNKDFTGARNITLTGELDAGSLDVSGDVDVDGTLETDALSINGTAVTSTAAELNILDGVTSTAAELNILDGVTATAAEINALDGITSTVTELNILDGVTASAADINLIDGITNGTVIASKAIITDSNKDITGGRNITISGELDAATLDISGDADIDGTLEADAITIGGVTLAETISDTVGAMVSSNTESNISVTYEDSDNTLDFALPAALEITTSVGVGGGSTNGVVISQGAIAIKNGGTQSYVDFYCESSNAHYTRLQAAAHSAYSGNVTVTLPATTGTLALTSSSITGNAATATALQNARTIHGVSFDGTANIDLTEVIQDTVGAMVSSNTESNITVTYEDSDGTLDFSVTGGGSVSEAFKTISVSGQDDVVADAAADTLTLVAGSNMTITTSASGDTITFASSGSGGSQNLFSTIAVSGQSNVVADSTTDTLTLVAGSGMTLTTDASGDSITFASSGSGGGGSSSSSEFAKNTFTGDGSTTAFTLTKTMSSEDGLIVFIDGVYQADNVYSVSGTTLTFATAPVNSRVIEVFQLEGGIVGTAPIVNTMTGDGSDTTLTLSVAPISENQTFLTIDGVVQHKSTYSISGTTLTFSTAPPTGTAVECITFNNVTAATDLVVDSFTGDGSDTTFTLSRQPLTENNTQVYLSGVYQQKSVYSISGTTLTFATAPANGISIEVVSMASASVNSAAILQDADNDTKIQVEESSDEDTIRMDIAGTEVLTLTNSAMTLKGTTPTLTIGDAGAEDTKIVFDGNAQDYYIGLDDSADDLIIGKGSAVGTTPAITIDENLLSTFAGAVTVQGAFTSQGIDDNADATAITIDSSENVGIGTTSPARPLEVTGSGDTLVRITGGSANAKGIEFYKGSGTATQLYNVSDDLRIFTNAAERMRINSSGQVGIGTSSPSTLLHINGSGDAIRVESTNAGAGGAQIDLLHFSASPADDDVHGVINFGGYYSGSSSAYGSSIKSIWTDVSARNSALTFTTRNADNFNEAMRIDSSGNVFFGKTGHDFDAVGAELFAPTGYMSITRNQGTQLYLHRMNNDGAFVEFWQTNNLEGYVNVSSGTVTLENYSDYRMKKNISDLGSSLDRVKSLRPVTFEYTRHAGYTHEGFIAHEVQEVLPQAVQGDKDAVNEEGEPVYQSYDKSLLIPLLTKAIQEQQELIETLTARIETLEGGE